MSFQLFTDQKNLNYIFTEKDLDSQQCKWLEFLADYNIDIAHHLGKANIVAEALSRRPVSVEPDYLPLGYIKMIRERM